MKIMHQRFVLHQPAYSTRSAHGTSLRNSYREMAGYVGRILNGAKTTDLPVQQPSTFELVLNLNAAKALALTIPTSILLRADEVIE
jgi:putative tryptophan/tyrosine transport system substrate-binding protein